MSKIKAVFSNPIIHYVVLAILCISLIGSLILPFYAGLKGVIVETNPIFWFVLSVTFVYVLLVREKHFLPAFVGILFIGLSLRLIPAVHSFYVGVDPWNELTSVHTIQSSGFNLLGNYYHSSIPVLQGLFLLIIPIFGEYNTVTYFGVIFGWILGLVFLYKLAREYSDVSTSLLVLLIYAFATAAFQYLSIPETIALPIGFAVIYYFQKNISSPNLKYMLATGGLFSLLIFTHYLTALIVLLNVGFILLVLRLQSKVPSRWRSLFFVWLLMVVLYLLYFQVYQNFLSNLLVQQLSSSVVLIPTGWSKPLWWWGLYVLPYVLMFSFLAIWALPPLFKRRFPNPSEGFATVCAGIFTIILSLGAPSSLPLTRVINQFGGYFSNGLSFVKKRRMNILVTVICLAFALNLVTQFPMTNGQGYYVGGDWISHSSSEVSAMQYLASNSTPYGNIIIDARCYSVLNSFLPQSKHLITVDDSRAIAIYNSSSTQDAWNLCRADGVKYVFVSNFYSTIADFGVYNSAFKFSDAQLTKFQQPYFSVFYTSPDKSVTIYSVNNATITT